MLAAKSLERKVSILINSVLAEEVERQLKLITKISIEEDGKERHKVLNEDIKDITRMFIQNYRLNEYKEERYKLKFKALVLSQIE